MKKKVFEFGVLVLFSSIIVLGAQEKYELTEIDIFSLERKVLGTEVSVLGISLGDSREAVLKALDKKESDVKKVNIPPDNMSDLEHDVIETVLNQGYSISFKDSISVFFSSDNLVTQIMVNNSFVSNLKGKTAEIFGLIPQLQKASMRASFGEPDYTDHNSSIHLDSLYYLDGFSFAYMNDSLVHFSILSNVRTKISKVLKSKAASKSKTLTTDFRNTSWGMSKEQIEKIEKGEVANKSTSRGLDILMYKGRVGGLNCLIGYYFAKNQLVEGRYVFYEKHTNKNDYIDDFNRTADSITKKYGQPTKEMQQWKNNLYKDDHSDWGLAVSIGHLVYQYDWKLPETTLKLQLTGDNYKITFILDYRCEIPKYKKLKEAAEAGDEIW